MYEKVVNDATCHQPYQQKAKERNFLEAKRADTQTGIGIDSRSMSTLQNGRVPQQKVVTDSSDETVSGFEPRTYRSEQSNFVFHWDSHPRPLVNKQLVIANRHPKLILVVIRVVTRIMQFLHL